MVRSQSLVRIQAAMRTFLAKSKLKKIRHDKLRTIFSKNILSFIIY